MVKSKSLAVDLCAASLKPLLASDDDEKSLGDGYVAKPVTKNQESNVENWCTTT